MRLTLFSCRWSISRNTSTHRALRVSGINNPSPFIWMQFLEYVLLVVLAIPSKRCRKRLQAQLPDRARQPASLPPSLPQRQHSTILLSQPPYHTKSYTYTIYPTLVLSRSAAVARMSTDAASLPQLVSDAARRRQVFLSFVLCSPGFRSRHETGLCSALHELRCCGPRRFRGLYWRGGASRRVDGSDLRGRMAEE